MSSGRRSYSRDRSARSLRLTRQAVAPEHEGEESDAAIVGAQAQDERVRQAEVAGALLQLVGVDGGVAEIEQMHRLADAGIDALERQHQRGQALVAARHPSLVEAAARVAQVEHAGVGAAQLHQLLEAAVERGIEIESASTAGEHALQRLQLSCFAAAVGVLDGHGQRSKGTRDGRCSLGPRRTLSGWRRPST